MFGSALALLVFRKASAVYDIIHAHILPPLRPPSRPCCSYTSTLFPTVGFMGLLYILTPLLPPLLHILH